MNVHITDWKKFEGKAKLSMWRRIGLNIEIQEMFEMEDDSSAVALFIDTTEKFKLFTLPIGINRNMPGLIKQSFNSKRQSFKNVARYYVLVNTTMRVAEWDKGRTDHDEYIAPHILH